MTQTTITIDDDLNKILTLLLQERKTKNKSQIIREALWTLAEKILPKNATDGALKSQE